MVKKYFKNHNHPWPYLFTVAFKQGHLEKLLFDWPWRTSKCCCALSVALVLCL